MILPFDKIYCLHLAEDKEKLNHLNKELEKFFNNKEFVNSVKDAIDFRTKEYYKNRFEHK